MWWGRRRNIQKTNRSVNKSNSSSEIKRQFDIESDVDDANKLHRLVSHYRSENKRQEVKLRDCKEKYKQEIAKLQSML